MILERGKISEHTYEKIVFLQTQPVAPYRPVMRYDRKLNAITDDTYSIITDAMLILQVLGTYGSVGNKV
jgi:hypothetical protein